MRCPLAVIENKKSLTIVRNGELVTVPFPFKPYVLCQSTMSPESPKEYIDLFSKQKIMLSKEEFDDNEEARNFYTAAGRKGVYYNSIKDTVMLDTPEWLRQFAQTEPLKILFLDIEVLADGSGVFPKASKVPIISIAMKRYKQDACVSMDYRNDDVQDKKMLEAFVQEIREFNPDIIVGYNVWFDIQYIIGRLQKHKMTLNFLCRDGSMPFYHSHRTNTQEFKVTGRIVMDLFDCVAGDQSLLGIKNRKLKTVCNWFNIPAIEVDTKDMRPLVNTQRLSDYNKSDVDVLETLFEIYYPQQEELADMMAIPLEDVINGYNSLIPKIYTGRRLVELGIVPLENNEDRYGETKFEAAYVDILKTGKFNTIYKLDFASLYPSIMMTFNIGPDTVQMISQSDYDPSKFSITSNQEFCYINIPDENFKKNFLVRIDFRKNSFIRDDMMKFMVMRQEIKRKLKVTQDPKEKTALNSQSWAIKVLMNTEFGFFGLKYSRFGDMAGAMAIVAIGRWLIKYVTNMMREHVIEIDTDGIYLDAEPDVDETNMRIAGLVAETIFQKSHLALEKEGPWVGYFYKSKNYVLMKGDKMTLHGAAVKSSRHTRLYDRVINDLARAILSDANQASVKELVMNMRDLTRYNIDDFMMHITLTKPKYEEGTMQDTLIKKLEPIIGRKVVSGDSIDYFKTKNGYDVIQNVQSVDQLDTDYYLESVSMAQAVFGLEDVHKTPAQLMEEEKARKRNYVIQRKRKLKEFVNSPLTEDPELMDMSKEAAQSEITRIEILQSAMLKKWPCPACGGTELEFAYPDGLKCVCGWVGTPLKPISKKRKRTVTSGVPTVMPAVPA